MFPDYRSVSYDYDSKPLLTSHKREHGWPFHWWSYYWHLPKIGIFLEETIGLEFQKSSYYKGTFCVLVNTLTKQRLGFFTTP